jgi:hypothetical protein
MVGKKAVAGITALLEVLEGNAAMAVRKPR